MQPANSLIVDSNDCEVFTKVEHFFQPNFSVYHQQHKEPQADQKQITIVLPPGNFTRQQPPCGGILAPAALPTTIANNACQYMGKE